MHFSVGIVADFTFPYWIDTIAVFWPDLTVYPLICFYL